jgi:MurNAc alpha-1-phosphate uridylyltransferase
MIFAAGRGERMRPLTDRVPKPLLEVGGRPLIVWHLERLAALGLREVVINVAHLAERLMERLGDGSAWGLRIVYSREPEPLETAGGLAYARPLLGDEPFLLVNGDVYCELGLQRLLTLELGRNLAHLVLVPNPVHHPQGDFTLRDGLAGNGDAARYTYAGIAVVSARLFESVERGARAQLVKLLRAAADRNLLSAELFEGLWCDVGTAERLAELDVMLRSRR